MSSAPVELVIAAFGDEEQAGVALKSLRELQRDEVVKILNAAVLVKNEKGRTRIRETQDVGAGGGAVFGAIVGALVGLLGGPAGAVVGAVAGAATGGVAASQIDMGFAEDALAEFREAMLPGSSAIIALVYHEWVDKLVEALEDLGAELYRQALAAEIAEQIAAEQKE